MDGVDVAMVQSKLTKLEQEGQTHLEAMCPAYSITLLHNATFRQPHQDTLFFEALYKVGHTPYPRRTAIPVGMLGTSVVKQTDARHSPLFAMALRSPLLLIQILVDLTTEAFPQRPHSDIESHMGELFRTSFFNVPEHT